jgi:PH domain/P21-Rho-binding domain
MTGMLTKKGHIIKNWKSRWFVLQGSRLFYFRDQQARDPIAEVNMTGARVTEAPNEARPYCLELNAVADKKTFHIAAPSGEASEQWIVALRKAGETATPTQIISGPTNVKHLQHMSVDSRTGGYRGVPAAWAGFFEASGISNQMVEQNPREAEAVLHFQMTVLNDDKPVEERRPPSVGPTPPLEELVLHVDPVCRHANSKCFGAN